MDIHDQNFIQEVLNNIRQKKDYKVDATDMVIQELEFLNIQDYSNVYSSQILAKLFVENGCEGDRK